MGNSVLTPSYSLPPTFHEPFQKKGAADNEASVACKRRDFIVIVWLVWLVICERIKEPRGRNATWVTRILLSFPISKVAQLDK